MEEEYLDEPLDEEELLTTESFFMTCKIVGLTLDDMEHLTIGGCLDYASDYLKLKNPDNNNSGEPQVRVKKASQQDFDNF